MSARISRADAPLQGALCVSLTSCPTNGRSPANGKRYKTLLWFVLFSWIVLQIRRSRSARRENSTSLRARSPDFSLARLNYYTITPRMLRWDMFLPLLHGFLPRAWRVLPALCLIGPVAALRGETAPAQMAPERQTLEALERRAGQIEEELGKLALENMVGGIGSVGFESQLHRAPQNQEWVQVDWGNPAQIDQIVLAPLLWQAGRFGYTASGFPVEFRVLAGMPGDKEGTMVASFGQKDQLLPRSSPLVIPCDTTASWVRVEVSLLSKRIQDRQYNFQLSEVLVFSGQDNVALNATVTSSSVGNLEGQRRFKEALTDGYLPYEMNVPDDKTSFGFYSSNKPRSRPSLLFDLGESLPINQINLFAIDSSSTSPRDSAGDYGIPDHFVIEGANSADFSDAVKLVDREKENPLDSGQILMLRFPESRHRYIRLTSLKHHNSMNFLFFSLLLCAFKKFKFKFFFSKEKMNK